MEDRLRLCFNTMEIDPKTVDELISEYGIDDDATKELDTIYKTLMKETPIPSGILDIIRTNINTAFNDHLGRDTAASRDFGMSSSRRWKIGMGAYMDQVVKTVSQTVDELVSSGDLTNMRISEDANVAIRTCASKMRVVLTVGPKFKKGMASLPFMCRSAYTLMSQRLDIITDSLKEVRDRSIITFHKHFAHIK